MLKYFTIEEQSKPSSNVRVEYKIKIKIYFEYRSLAFLSHFIELMKLKPLRKKKQHQKYIH